MCKEKEQWFREDQVGNRPERKTAKGTGTGPTGQSEPMNSPVAESTAVQPEKETQTPQRSPFLKAAFIQLVITQTVKPAADAATINRKKLPLLWWKQSIQLVKQPIVSYLLYLPANPATSLRPTGVMTQAVAYIGKEFSSQQDYSVACNKRLLITASKAFLYTVQIGHLIANKVQVTRPLSPTSDSEVQVVWWLNSKLSEFLGLIKSLLIMNI